jgi:hypothetical protein
MRYCWPAEIDTMAGDAGLRLAGRWASSNCEPYGPQASRRHVSMYRIA